MSCEEWTELLADYALGLLTAPQCERVEAHVATCEPCRAALLQERALAHAVRTTVHTATRPAPDQLRALMPPLPQGRTRQLWLWRPVAALALLAVLFLGSLQITQSGPAYALPTAATTSIVATATQIPTAGSTETPQISARQAGAPVIASPIIPPPAAPPRPARRP